MTLHDIPLNSTVTVQIWTRKIRVDLVGIFRRGEVGVWTVTPNYHPGFAGSLAVFDTASVTSITTGASGEHIITIAP